MYAQKQKTQKNRAVTQQQRHENKRVGFVDDHRREMNKMLSLQSMIRSNRPENLSGVDILEKKINPERTQNTKTEKSKFPVQLAANGSYWVNPTWEKWGNMGGSMSVTLGPESGDVYGSGPDPKVAKRTYDQLKMDFPSANWKKGHLLNDNLGGLGDSENLTPLTAKGNAGHRTLEGIIKNAVLVAKKFKQYNPHQPIQYGVFYSVEADETNTWGDRTPENKVANFLNVRANVKKRTGAAIADVNGTEPIFANSAYAAVLNKARGLNEPVDNQFDDAYLKAPIKKKKIKKK